MSLHWADITVFVVFFAVVVGVSMYKSRKEKSGEDFFLASRGLVWPWPAMNEWRPSPWSSSRSFSCRNS